MEKRKKKKRCNLKEKIIKNKRDKLLHMQNMYTLQTSKYINKIEEKKGKKKE